MAGDVKSSDLLTELRETQNALRDIAVKLDALRSSSRTHRIVISLLAVVLIGMVVLGVNAWASNRRFQETTVSSRMEGCQNGNELRAAIIAGDRQDDRADDRRFALALAEITNADQQTLLDFLELLDRENDEAQEAGDIPEPLLPRDCDAVVDG